MVWNPLRAMRDKLGRAAGLVASVGLLALPGQAYAVDQHNSFVGYLVLLVPAAWRDRLYSAENWGQLDVVPNTIFVGLLTLVILGLLARRLL